MLEERLFEESSGLRIGYIICFVTAVGFICSLTYNYGYFWFFATGIRVLSIGDILTSYTLWIPGLGTLFFAYCFDMFLQHIEKKEQKLLIKKHKKFIRRLLGLPHIILLIAMSSILVAYFGFDYILRPLLVWFACCYVWLSLSGVISASKIFVGRTNHYVLGIFLFIPVILSLMFALGLDKAHCDSQLHVANANIYFITDLTHKHPTILLRHLERGLLAKEVNSPDYILFSWDNINSIEILAHAKKMPRHSI